MKAITIRQPWATLIAEGCKDIENRSQRWPAVDRVAIHSGQTTDWDAFAQPRVMHATGYDPDTRALLGNRFLHGHVLAVATITGCHPAGDGCCGSTWADRTPTVRFHLVIDNVTRLREPVFAKGRLGLWDLPGPALYDVLRQTGAAA